MHILYVEITKTASETQFLSNNCGLSNSVWLNSPIRLQNFDSLTARKAF